MRVWVLCLLLVQAWAAHGAQLEATASHIAVKHEDLEATTLRGFGGRRLLKKKPKKPKCPYGKHPRTGACLPFCKWGYTRFYTCKPKPKCRWGWDKFFNCRKVKPICTYGYDKDFNCLAKPNCPFGYTPDLKRCLPAPLPTASPNAPIG